MENVYKLVEQYPNTNDRGAQLTSESSDTAQ